MLWEAVEPYNAFVLNPDGGGVQLGFNFAWHWDNTTKMGLSIYHPSKITNNNDRMILHGYLYMTTSLSPS